MFSSWKRKLKSFTQNWHISIFAGISTFSIGAGIPYPWLECHFFLATKRIIYIPTKAKPTSQVHKAFTVLHSQESPENRPKRDEESHSNRFNSSIGVSFSSRNSLCSFSFRAKPGTHLVQEITNYSSSKKTKQNWIFVYWVASISYFEFWVFIVILVVKVLAVL